MVWLRELSTATDISFRQPSMRRTSVDPWACSQEGAGNQEAAFAQSQSHGGCGSESADDPQETAASFGLATHRAPAPQCSRLVIADVPV